MMICADLIAHRPITPGDLPPQAPGEPTPTPQPDPVPQSPPPVRAIHMTRQLPPKPAQKRNKVPTPAWIQAPGLHGPLWMSSTRH